MGWHISRDADVWRLRKVLVEYEEDGHVLWSTRFFTCLFIRFKRKMCERRLKRMQKFYSK